MDNNNNNCSKNNTAKQVQQNFAESFSFKKGIFWDLLTAGQEDILKAKIAELLPDQERGQNAIISLREKLFNSIWTQRKYSNGNSLTAVIIVLVTNATDLNCAEMSMQFSYHPVFRARKCCAGYENSFLSDNCCMIYIDEVGRVYQNWAAYKANNVLPKGIMIAPRNGIYSLDESMKVVLDIYATPAASATNKTLGVLDTTTTVGSLLSAAAPIAALCAIPVAAPLMAGAALVGLVSTSYMALRSGAQLADRNRHEQSISLADLEGRKLWLGVGAGVVGIGAAGATTALTTATAAGQEVNTIAQYAVNGFGPSSIMPSGSNVFDLYLKNKDNESVMKLDILQLTGSLVLFTHSAYNYRMASLIITETQDGTIRQFRENINNRQSKAFNRMYKDALRLSGEKAGKMDLIRGVSEMPTKQQYEDLFNIAKELKSHGNGTEAILNNEKLARTQDLHANGQYNIGPDILSTITQPIPDSYQAIAHSSTRTNDITQSTVDASVLFVRPRADVPEWVANIQNVEEGILLGMCSVLVQGVMVALSDFGISILERITNVDEFQSLVEEMAKIFCEPSFRFIMHITCSVIDIMVDDLDRELRRCINTQMILSCIIRYISDNIRQITIDYLESQTVEILNAVQKYFLSGNPIDSVALWIRCRECVGFYKLTNL